MAPRTRKGLSAMNIIKSDGGGYSKKIGNNARVNYITVIIGGLIAGSSNRFGDRGEPCTAE